MKMLLLTLISILLFFTTQSKLSTAEMAKYKALQEKCFQETGFNPTTVMKSAKEEAENKELKCFYKCLMVETDTMDGTTGVLNLENSRKIGFELTGNSVRWENVINECKDQNDEDICEKAYKLITCAMDEIKKVVT